MEVREIEGLPEVKQAAEVLHVLETKGINESAIAAGWTRSLLTGGSTNDIDVSYVGEVHYEQARAILEETLETVNPVNKDMWDVKGVWNAQLAYGVEHTVDNFLLYYLNSIDSVYLASDGRLHDPTGYGFEDAKTKTLRINDYDLIDHIPTPSEEVNVCLENCRRLAKFGWTPTERTVERIVGSVPNWNLLSEDEAAYFIKKLKTKYKENERAKARTIYDKYGWGFIFDLLLYT
ncbi:MAG: hypothetical protein WAW80_00370 [Candidatus Saccharimonadales bacterium]